MKDILTNFAKVHLTVYPWTLVLPTICPSRASEVGDYSTVCSSLFVWSLRQIDFLYIQFSPTFDKRLPETSLPQGSE